MGAVIIVVVRNSVNIPMACGNPLFVLARVQLLRCKDVDLMCIFSGNQGGVRRGTVSMMCV